MNRVSICYKFQITKGISSALPVIFIHTTVVYKVQRALEVSYQCEGTSSLILGWDNGGRDISIFSVECKIVKANQSALTQTLIEKIEVFPTNFFDEYLFQ